MEVFALMGQRAGGGNSPTQRVLIDWGTKVSATNSLDVVITPDHPKVLSYFSWDGMAVGMREERGWDGGWVGLFIVYSVKKG